MFKTIWKIVGKIVGKIVQARKVIVNSFLYGDRSANLFKYYNLISKLINKVLNKFTAG